MAAAKREAMLTDIIRLLKSGALLHSVGARFRLAVMIAEHL